MTYIITEFICRSLNKFLELIHIVYLRNIYCVACTSSEQVRHGKRNEGRNLNKATEEGNCFQNCVHNSSHCDSLSKTAFRFKNRKRALELRLICDKVSGP